MNVLLGLATLPIGAGSALTANIAKPLVPLLGKKIATNIATGVSSSLTSGAVEGFGRGIIEGENPLKTSTQDALLGGVFGGLGSFELGKITKNIDRSNAVKTGDVSTYVDNYLDGIVNPNKTDLRDFRAFISNNDLSNLPPDFWFDLIDNDEFDYKKVMKLVEKLKKGKYNPLRSQAKSVKIVNISSKQKEYIFNEINSNISEIEKEKGIITRRLHNYDEKKIIFIQSFKI